jgi:DNA polymerase I
LIKVAMIQMDQAIHARRLETRMLLSVHDEIVFEVPDSELGAMRQLAPQVMENVWDLKTPLKVNVAWGPNWAAAH